MMLLLKLSAQMRIQLPSQTLLLLYTQNDAFAEGFLCGSVYSTSRRRPSFCIRKMMFSLRGSYAEAYTAPLADAQASVYAK